SPDIRDLCGKVATGIRLHENRFQVPARLDYHSNERHYLFARYQVTKIDATVPYEISPNDVLTSSGVGADDMGQSLAFGSTYVFSPTVVNSLRISGNRVGANKPAAKFFSPADV